MSVCVTSLRTRYPCVLGAQRQSPQGAPVNSHQRKLVERCSINTNGVKHERKE